MLLYWYCNGSTLLIHLDVLATGFSAFMLSDTSFYLEGMSETHGELGP
jgi:hypothetical protein